MGDATASCLGHSKTSSRNRFDVIIVDEASQCGIEALPLFYLAKKDSDCRR